jgi:predicted nuclease with TOPRIM domain
MVKKECPFCKQFAYLNVEECLQIYAMDEACDSVRIFMRQMNIESMQAQQNCAQMEDTINRLLREKKGFEEQNIELIIDLEHIGAEKKSLEERNKTLQAKIDDAVDNSEKILINNNILEDSNRKLTTENQALKRKIKSLETTMKRETRRLKKRIETMSKKMKESINVLSEAHNDDSTFEPEKDDSSDSDISIDTN